MRIIYNYSLYPVIFCSRTTTSPLTQAFGIIQRRETSLQIMTGSEILNIVVTVGISQLCIDLLSNYFVYKGDNYQRVCRRLESATSKLRRAEAELAKNPNKHQKKYDRTKAEYDHVAAEVAKKHMPPAVRCRCWLLFR